MTSTAIQTNARQTPLPTFTPRADIVAIESGYQIGLSCQGSPRKTAVELNRACSHARQTSETARIEPIAYERSFRLSDDVEGERIQAELKNGLLTLTLPKAERALPRQIPVELN